jgi:hypothetical protein
VAYTMNDAPGDEFIPPENNGMPLAGSRFQD